MSRPCFATSLAVVTILGVLTALPQTSHAAAPLPARDLLVLPQSETDASLVLLWDKPVVHDNVAGYEVYQNGELVATTAAGKTFYGAAHLVPDTSYSFYVVAKDAAGNRAAPSATVTASTRPAGVVINVSAAPYSAKGDGDHEEHGRDPEGDRCLSRRREGSDSGRHVSDRAPGPEERYVVLRCRRGHFEGFHRRQ